jgi:hypothetical protein
LEGRIHQYGLEFAEYRRTDDRSVIATDDVIEETAGMASSERQ